ncbi:cleavage and polyadenylation specificity factor subunit 7 [Kryptolebias marmoratus]|uniref:Cleavage and polyadenylation specific factor 7 n=1 Tax=Kryptolebias marmoratus TaxID=37003 RepID=A0A3Q3A0J5_KRYMA|nr:cleavage and polyadenylation specificity factor subunit 7 [Kryptolebias marmoratus]XP_037835899.1 cleavage and polyadenylation specificity factor subunit 7 [Kryptolebias marmoratus]
MAAARPAAGASSSKSEHIDLYGDLYANDEEDLDKIAEANELFDAVLTGTVDQDKKVTTKVPSSKGAPAKEEGTSTDAKTHKAEKSQRRLSLYIGNFPWWTSDEELLGIAQRLSVKDITQIKFAENKVNGQSRGYAEVVVTSNESLQILLEKIPQCHINGESLDCRFATLQNLRVFEEIANKRMPLRVNSDSKESNSTEKPPTPSLKESTAPPIPSLFLPHSLPNSFPSTSNPFLVQPPPLFPNMPPGISALMPPHMFPPPPVQMSVQPSPSLHMNPAFFSPVQDGHSSKSYSQQTKPPQNKDGDFEELMTRNKTIASSAITKAVSGATAGDLHMAMETLLTAIAIIKQSKVYRDERCQALVTSLKDCLVSIQGNNGYERSSRSREKDRDRGRDRDHERDRERDRDHERDRERDRDHERDRERYRERYRDDFYDRESAGKSRRHRERSWSGERDKERSGERERYRDYRDRYR